MAVFQIPHWPQSGQPRSVNQSVHTANPVLYFTCKPVRTYAYLVLSAILHLPTHDLGAIFNHLKYLPTLDYLDCQLSSPPSSSPPPHPFPTFLSPPALRASNYPEKRTSHQRTPFLQDTHHQYSWFFSILACLTLRWLFLAINC